MIAAGCRSKGLAAPERRGQLLCFTILDGGCDWHSAGATLCTSRGRGASGRRTARPGAGAGDAPGRPADDRRRRGACRVSPRRPRRGRSDRVVWGTSLGIAAAEACATTPVPWPGRPPPAPRPACQRWRLVTFGAVFSRLMLIRNLTRWAMAYATGSALSTVARAMGGGVPGPERLTLMSATLCLRADDVEAMAARGTEVPPLDCMGSRSRAEPVGRRRADPGVRATPARPDQSRAGPRHRLSNEPSSHRRRRPDSTAFVQVTAPE